MGEAGRYGGRSDGSGTEVMDERPYSFKSDETEYVYRFDSVSEQKTVRKLIVFTDIGLGQFYNLALLDELPDGALSDSNTSNNSDMVTVLATVFRVIDDFLNRFPGVFVYFSGSDTRRTRLYRIAISHELARLQEEYIILGRHDDEAVPFAPNQEYDGFLIGKKL
jgi:hypothetical protein